MLLLLVGGGSSAASDEARFTPARCAALIASFDRLVVSRYDHRSLGVGASDLDQARALRLSAEQNCVAGRIGFGVHAIEDALLTIHVIPEGLPSRARKEPD